MLQQQPAKHQLPARTSHQAGAVGSACATSKQTMDPFFLASHGLPVLGVITLLLFAGGKGNFSPPPARASAAAFLFLLALVGLAFVSNRGGGGGSFPFHAPQTPRPQRPQAPPHHATTYNFNNLTLPYLAPPYNLDFSCTSDGTPLGTRTTCAPYFCSAVNAKTSAPCNASDTTAANMTAYLAEQAVRVPSALPHFRPFFQGFPPPHSS